MHLLLHGLRTHAAEDPTTAAAACLMLARLAKGDLAAEAVSSLVAGIQHCSFIGDTTETSS